MGKQNKNSQAIGEMRVSHLLTVGLRSAYAWFTFLLTYWLTSPRQEGHRDTLCAYGCSLSSHLDLPIFAIYGWNSCS